MNSPYECYDKTLVLTPKQIQIQVKKLAKQISTDLANEKDEAIFLGVLKGAFIFLSDLVRYITVPIQVDFIRLASYGSSSVTSGIITKNKLPELNLASRTVIVVEDIIDTGRTINWLLSYLKSLGCRQVKLCIFLDKSERREINLIIDYIGFHISHGFLVGYGLDFNESYRYLPGVYRLNL